MLQCNFHYVQASEEEMAEVEAATKQMEEELASPPSWPLASLPITEMMKMPGLGKAAKIMEKYGFRAGEGLGKQSQGIKQALVMEQNSHLKGKIVNLDEVEEEATVPTWVPIWGTRSPWGPFSVFGSPLGPHFSSKVPIFSI